MRQMILHEHLGGAEIFPVKNHVFEKNEQERSTQTTEEQYRY
jgi:hypothetical protein